MAQESDFLTEFGIEAGSSARSMAATDLPLKPTRFLKMQALRSSMCHTETPLKNEDTTSVIVLAGVPLLSIFLEISACGKTVTSADLRALKSTILRAVEDILREQDPRIGPTSLSLRSTVSSTTRSLIKNGHSLESGAL